jgi:hypothetical protein
MTINGIVYNSMDKVPEEIKKMLNSEKFQNLENTINTKLEWKINGTTYTNFDDIPEESKKYFADSDNNGIPDMFEVNQNKNSGLSDLYNGTLIETPQSKQSINSVVSKPSKIKETPLDEFYNQNNLNEKKAGLSIKSTHLLIAFLVIIIVGLAAYILMSGKI